MLDTLQVHLTNEHLQTIWDYIKDYSFLITLILGAILGFGVDKYNNRLKFIKTRQYFFNCLYELMKSLEHQLTLYKSYVKSIGAEQDHFEKLRVNVGFSLNIINNVSKEDMYKIFILKYVKKDKKNHLKRFTALNNGFNLIQHHNDIDRQQEDNIKNTNDRLKLEYSQSRKSLMRKIDTFLNSNQPDSNFANLKKDVNDLKKSVYSSGIPKSHTVFDDLDKFIEPLFNIVKKYNYVEYVHDLSGIFHTVGEMRTNRNDAINKINDETKILNNVYIDFMNTLVMYKKYLDSELKKEVKPIEI